MGPISIFTRLMKPSLSGFSVTAVAGAAIPSTQPVTMPTSTQKYNRRGSPRIEAIIGSGWLMEATSNSGPSTAIPA